MAAVVEASVYRDKLTYLHSNREEGDVSYNYLLSYQCQKYNITPIDCNCQKYKVLCDALGISTESPPIHEYNVSCDITYNAIRGGFNVFAAVIGILGNCIVLFVTIKNWKTASVCHRLIGGLAVSDALFSVFQLMFSIPELWTCYWLYGPVMCILLNGFSEMSTKVDLGFLIVIAVERYVGIIYPFSHGLGERKLVFCIFINIILSVCSTLPVYMYQHLDVHNICNETWPSSYSAFTYSLVTMVLYFMMPVIIILVISYRIVKHLYSEEKVLDNLHGGIKTIGMKKRRLRDNKRIMMILITALVCLIALVLPNRLVWIIMDSIGPDNFSEGVYRALTIIGFVPISFHVAVNPFIYSIIDAKFRKKVAALLPGYRKIKARISEHITPSISNSSVDVVCTSTSAISINNTRL